VLFRNGRTRATERAGSLYAAARPAVQRAMSDKDVQDALRRSYDAGRRVYEELWGQPPKKAAKRAIDDNRLHANLSEALSGLREAATKIGKQEKKRRFNRGLVALVIGAVAAAVIGPKVAKALRGGGGEPAA
jgi:hypothetical protein